MTPQQENALRSIARQANSEIKKPDSSFRIKTSMTFCRSVLKKHRETVTLMGFTPTHLSPAIGMLNGVFGNGEHESKIIRELQAPFFYYSHSPSSVLTKIQGLMKDGRHTIDSASEIEELQRNTAIKNAPPEPPAISATHCCECRIR